MVHNWAWYGVGINDYSKVLITHKNMVCCGFVVCSITSDLLCKHGSLSQEP